MDLPFSADAFFEVFGHYNRAWWPAVVALWLAAAAVLAGVARGAPDARAVTVLLVVLWSWGGAVYHAAYFTDINPAAWIFAALFLVEAALLFWSGAVRRELSFGSASKAATTAGIGLAAYALAYPGLSLALGHPYPDTPTFGVPCPTTIFTVALLLTCARLPVIVTLVPLAWAVVGGSAALFLGVGTDYALLACGPLLAGKVLLDAGLRPPGGGRDEDQGNHDRSGQELRPGDQSGVGRRDHVGGQLRHPAGRQRARRSHRRRHRS